MVFQGLHLEVELILFPSLLLHTSVESNSEHVIYEDISRAGGLKI